MKPEKVPLPPEVSGKGARAIAHGTARASRATRPAVRIAMAWSCTDRDEKEAEVLRVLCSVFSQNRVAVLGRQQHLTSFSQLEVRQLRLTKGLTYTRSCCVNREANTCLS